MHVGAHLNAVTAGKKGKIKKFMERGQGISYSRRRGEHLDKEETGRIRKNKKHFIRYEKTKKRLRRG